jgi:hypothetical protein
VFRAEDASSHGVVTPHVLLRGIGAISPGAGIGAISTGAGIGALSTGAGIGALSTGAGIGALSSGAGIGALSQGSFSQQAKRTPFLPPPGLCKVTPCKVTPAIPTRGSVEACGKSSLPRLLNQPLEDLAGGTGHCPRGSGSGGLGVPGSTPCFVLKLFVEWSTHPRMVKDPIYMWGCQYLYQDKVK